MVGEAKFVFEREEFDQAVFVLCFDSIPQISGGKIGTNPSLVFLQDPPDFFKSQMGFSLLIIPQVIFKLAFSNKNI